MVKLRSAFGVALGITLVAVNLAACLVVRLEQGWRGNDVRRHRQRGDSGRVRRKQQCSRAGGGDVGSYVGGVGGLGRAGKWQRRTAGAHRLRRHHNGDGQRPGDHTGHLDHPLRPGSGCTPITISSAMPACRSTYFRRTPPRRNTPPILLPRTLAPNPLSGVGDVAVYTLAPFAGMPDVYAHKGTVTCELKPSSTVSDYKITVDPSSAFAGIATKDAQAAWATKAAGLCTARLHCAQSLSRRSVARWSDAGQLRHVGSLSLSLAVVGSLLAACSSTARPSGFGVAGARCLSASVPASAPASPSPSGFGGVGLGGRLRFPRRLRLRPRRRRPFVRARLARFAVAVGSHDRRCFRRRRGGDAVAQPDVTPRRSTRPQLTAPVGVRPWLAAMTTSQRRELNGRVDSQLLLGERVVVERGAGLPGLVLSCRISRRRLMRGAIRAGFPLPS